MYESLLWLLARVVNAQIARTWAERAQAELGAARRFRDLASAVRSAGAVPEMVGLLESAAEDEDQHAYLCARMAKELGHPTGFESLEGRETVPAYSWSKRPDPRDRVLLNMVLMGCITESINASLMNSIYVHARHTASKAVIHKILKDEVKHGQLGWAYLNEEVKVRDCCFVSDYLAEMLDISVKDELFLPALEDSDEETYAYGVMPVSHRLEQFCATLSEVVIPGFEHFGIDASPIVHWRDQKLEMLTATVS